MKVFLMRALIFALLIVGVGVLSASLDTAPRWGLYTIVAAMVLLAGDNRLVRERELDALRQELQTYARRQADETRSRRDAGA